MEGLTSEQIEDKESAKQPESINSILLRLDEANKRIEELEEKVKRLFFLTDSW